MAVAPTQQGKSYSDMVNEQIGLIQRQRAANLNQRLAQEEKNREFRTKQYENIYDFDVSGLAGGDVELLGKLQKQLANSLNPDSDQSYSSSQELVADISYINNVYNEMKRWGETGMSGRQSYQQGILQPDRGDGTVFVGTEDTLSARNAAWEQGAFANAQILGEPGQRQIIGDMLNQDGNVMKQGIDFFQNEWRSRPDMFWRPEIGEGTPYLDTVAAEYIGRTGIDPNKVSQTAGVLFDSDSAIYDRIVKDLYRKQSAEDPNMPSLEDLLKGGKESLSSYGLDEASIKKLYIAQAKIGVGLQKRQPVEVLGIFSGNVIETEAGLGGLQINPERPLELASGNFQGVNINGLAINDNGDYVVTYSSNGEPVEEVVEQGTADYNNITRGITPDGVKTLIKRRNVSNSRREEAQEDETPKYSLEELKSERDRLVGLFAERFKEETGEEISDYINTDLELMENRLNSSSSLNNPGQEEQLYEIFIKEYEKNKEREGRVEERKRRVEREGILPRITGPKFEGGGIIPRVRRFFGA